MPAKKTAANVVPWNEIVGYEDDSADFVQLYRKGERKAISTMTIPTPTEVDRVAALRLLDQQMIPRRETRDGLRGQDLPG
jgi:hypothetical protein